MNNAAAMRVGVGMTGAHKAIPNKDEWLTPPYVIAALGAFDLDPCSPINRPVDTAARHLTIADDGLAAEWSGRVWLNPPYGDQTGHWLERLVNHGRGTALIFARTETDTFFQYVWNAATAVFFFRGRLTFHNVDGTPGTGNAGAPSCLVAYGADDAKALRASGLPGHFLWMRA